MIGARIAVLASGGGSNFQALIDYLAASDASHGARIVLLATDRAGAGAIARAEAAGIDAVVTESRLAPDALAVADALEHAEADIVALAGYLQLIPAAVAERYHGRMVNVHPGPLPEFGGIGMYGARVHRAVLAAHLTVSGPTVHFVDDEYDHGAAIAHWPVPVLPGDDEHTLAARVLRAEHLLYPRVVAALAAGNIALTADGVTPSFLDAPLPLFDPNLDDSHLAALLDHATRTAIRFRQDRPR